MREKKLIREGEAIWAECIGDEEATVLYIEARERFALARKKLDQVERKLLEDMGIDRKGC